MCMCFFLLYGSWTASICLPTNGRDCDDDDTQGHLGVLAAESWLNYGCFSVVSFRQVFYRFPLSLDKISLYMYINIVE